MQSWNQTTEDLVKLYLDAKEMIKDGSANFTEEQISKFEKNADNYYLSDIYQANETLKAIYVGFMIAGVLIWIISTVVLVFNERKYKALHYVRQKVADYLVESQEGQTDESNDNRLIFAKGDLEFERPAKDELLGFESTEGILLKRNVEILQWQRKYDSVKDQVFYHKIWSQKPIDSSGFPSQNQNPKIEEMPFKTETFYGRIKLGDFTLRKHQMDDLLEPQESTPLEIEKIDEVLNDNFQL